MKALKIALLATACVAVLVPGSVSASADGSATKAVRQANKTISKLLTVNAEPGSPKEARVAKQVTDSVRGFLDVDELGRRAMVDHWAKLDEAQRKEFLDLLRALVEANYIKGLRARVDYKVVYSGEENRGDTVLVSTEVKAKRRGRPVTIAVDYSVRKEGKTFRVFDIATDGVGLVENYRAQFNRIIEKEKFDGLLSRMRKQREAIK